MTIAKPLPDALTSRLPAQDADWWRGAVIYQIYPRSFMDSNGDGIGDLPGITSKLDYIAALGVDAIWISPFFQSPMRDFGYDISNYREVDPIFGTLADFDRLLARAHALGLRVLIDQVLSHSSDEHAWFKESRAGRDNPKADWYVWADPKPDGTPPNNWLSVFGGSAWQWNSRRQQYYLHNFLPSQPDLNLHCRAVQDQLLEEVRFWLDRGVDGFRFDAANFYFHDQQLRDNPPLSDKAWRDLSTPLTNPYGRQRHVHDKSQPENLEFLQRLRALLDQYGATTSVGEIGDDNALAIMAQYTGGGNKLHMAYTFNLIGDDLHAPSIRAVVEDMDATLGDGWCCWSIGNHDAQRILSRVGGQEPAPALALVLLTMMLSLRGSACLYQGEELGLTEAELTFEQLRDPYGIAFWPEFKGRDGCRTPMPWVADAPHAGFSTGVPWLPVCPSHYTRAVNAQLAHPESVLRRARQFILWRKDQPLLHTGAIRFYDAPQSCLLLSRSSGNQCMLAAFNFSGETRELPLPVAGTVTSLEGHGLHGTLAANRIVLPAYGAWFGSVQPSLTLAPAL